MVLLGREMGAGKGRELDGVGNGRWDGVGNGRWDGGALEESVDDTSDLVG